jgi:hypothetical protein
MAQRKPSSGGKPAAKKGTSRPAGKPGAGSPAKATAAGAPQLRKKPPTRKPGKSIVNQKQTPWGTIITIIAVLAFAGAVIGIVIATHKSSNTNPNNTSGGCGNPVNARYCMSELSAAKQIPGVVYHRETNHTHVLTNVHYDTTPPTGGNHNPFWADCDGAVYPQPIANENAVHALEHGAVWVTYKEGLPASQVAKLAADVQGQTKVFMSPYPNLSSAVSLQAWGYQLKVNSVTDPRITQFIATLSANDSITPEVTSCANPSFKAAPSIFGHPISAPQAPTTSAATSNTTSAAGGSSGAANSGAGSSAP